MLFVLLAALASTPAVVPLTLRGEVDEEHVTPLVEAIQASRGAPVLLTIDSPGGDVEAGLALARVIEAHGSVTCLVDGEADSMAAYILQACQVRVMTRRSRLLFHDPRFMTSRAMDGRALATMLEDQRTLATAMAAHVCRRLNVSWEECRSHVERQWWLSFIEAQEVGAVDVVVD